jgi:hypothetical protein
MEEDTTNGDKVIIGAVEGRQKLEAGRCGFSVAMPAIALASGRTPRPPQHRGLSSGIVLKERPGKTQRCSRAPCPTRRGEIRSTTISSLGRIRSQSAACKVEYSQIFSVLSVLRAKPILLKPLGLAGPSESLSAQDVLSALDNSVIPAAARLEMPVDFEEARSSSSAKHRTLPSIVRAYPQTLEGFQPGLTLW